MAYLAAARAAHSKTGVFGIARRVAAFCDSFVSAAALRIATRLYS
jgi:hypothetical protein